MAGLWFVPDLTPVAKPYNADLLSAFCNGVLNTDNTSIMGLSVDFGPFAFLDNFDPDYTPNHDDYALSRFPFSIFE
jgi:uncharacterized protein YdiU (UPF0061 family)